jgi:hypothetical protein
MANDRVAISDIVNEIGNDLANKYPNGWTKPDANNELRRHIAVAMNIHGWPLGGVPGILPHIRLMTEQRFISPRSAFNGLPPNKPEDVDLSWTLTCNEATKVKIALSRDIKDRLQYAQQEYEMRQAGRYTLEEVAGELAKQSGWQQRRWLNLILDHVKSGALALRNPQDYSDTLPYQVPQEITSFYDQVHADDVNLWLSAHPEWKIAYRLNPHTEFADDSVGDLRLEADVAERVYNGKLINWVYWVRQMPALTAAQAARLMSALDPDIFVSLEDREDNYPNHNNSSAQRDNARKFQRLAEAKGKTSESPIHWLEWASRHQFKVHAGFRIAVEELRNTLEPAEQTSKPENEIERSTGLDGEPKLNKGKNSRTAVDAWVKWQATELIEPDDNGNDLAERIQTLAHRWGYQSERGKDGQPLPLTTIIKMLPTGITGGRGKNRRKSSK